MELLNRAQQAEARGPPQKPVDQDMGDGVLPMRLWETSWRRLLLRVFLCMDAAQRTVVVTEVAQSATRKESEK